HLPLLQDLTLQFAHELDDALITLGEATPGLHRLAISAYLSKPLRQLFTNLPSTLKELHIYYTYPHSIPIPWYSVPRLHLYPPKGYFRDPWYFIQELKRVFSTQNQHRLAVNDLTIQVDSISLSKCDEPNELFYEEVIPTMLELMQPSTSIKHLRFFSFIDFRWWANDIRMGSVESVTLYEHPSSVSDSPDLKQGRLTSLQPFLSMFPSLRSLRFSGLGLLAVGGDAPPPIAPDSFSVFIQHEPRLASLLASLRDTRVEEVRYRTTVKSDRELRIRRARPTEEFEGEWWNM
ncbi:RHTO0S16e00474g1_1, partial [Rhodotorula toruloides]